jgi:hypothetical protein
MFRLVAFLCILFLLLTTLSMFYFPGGIVGDPSRQGYAFFANFFSDLGRTRTLSGQSNLTSMTLFIIALVLLAIALTFFFIAFAKLFTGSSAARWTSRIASALGISSAVCFVGVAATPWDLLLNLHNQFVLFAFGFLFVAVLLELTAIRFQPVFPRRFAPVFAGFAGILFAYVLLLIFGPSPKTAHGLLIQATAQKIIAYTAVLTFFIQSVGAKKGVISLFSPSPLL